VNISDAVQMSLCAAKPSSCISLKMRCVQGSHPGKEAGDEGHREVRTAALRLLLEVWVRFPDRCDYSPFWPRFFSAVSPLIPRMLVEVSHSH
jgi:hypothetical protein